MDNLLQLAGLPVQAVQLLIHGKQLLYKSLLGPTILYNHNAYMPAGIEGIILLLDLLRGGRFA
jgi:hypothetical protein